MVGGRGPTNPCVAEVGKLFLSMILSDSEKKIFGRKNLVSKKFGCCSVRLVNPNIGLSRLTGEN